jgi:pyrimidine deaminase RibD-like protein
MIDEAQKIDLMHAAIEEAKKSVAEDERIHPKVGAVLADTFGKILHRAHRGEFGAGAHAEYALLEKARNAGSNLTRTVLFVTLEPCTRRGKRKIPCAVRVAESGISRIYIGTLDPDPRITGRGETFLSYQMPVERFPHSLVKEIREMDANFFAQHWHEHVPAVSLYAGASENDKSHVDFKPLLAGQREGLLQQSLDLISGTSGQVWIFSGMMSWLRELQGGLLLAKLDGREIRILCDTSKDERNDFESLKATALALGADVAVSTCPIVLRGTLVSPLSEEATMISVERNPALHGMLIRGPHELGMLDGFARLFEAMWKESVSEQGKFPSIEPISYEKIIEILQEGVPMYADAHIEHSLVPVEDLSILPTYLERFKLFRLNLLAALKQRHDVPEPAVISGSPWPITPPVIEAQDDGRLVVLDGAHRAYSALQRGEKKLDAVVISGVREHLPATPLADWDEVEIITAKLPREKRYRDYRPELFRPIRSVLERVVDSL